MDVLITGGAGYIGVELAYKLADHPMVNRVMIYDSLASSNAGVFCGLRKFGGAVEVWEHDILDNRALQSAVEKSDVVGIWLLTQAESRCAELIISSR